MQNNNSKLNTVLLVVLIIIVGFVLWKMYNNDKKVAYTPMSETDQVSSQNNHKYSNAQYSFYFDADNVVSKDLSFQNNPIKVIGFEKPNRGVNDGREAVVYISPNLDPSWTAAASQPVVINGVTYQYYSQEQDVVGISHFYWAKNNGLYYRIITNNPSYMNYFGFLN